MNWKCQLLDDKKTTATPETMSDQKWAKYRVGWQSQSSSDLLECALTRLTISRAAFATGAFIA